jgi:hypothetical protein
VINGVIDGILIFLASLIINLHGRRRNPRATKPDMGFLTYRIRPRQWNEGASSCWGRQQNKGGPGVSCEVEKIMPEKRNR